VVVVPSEQFSQAVRGAGARPIATTAAGSIQTDNYPAGDGFEFDGSAYPYTFNADNVDAIQDVMISEAGDVDMEIETIQGDTFTVRLAETVGRWEIWEIQSITFRDPRGTAAALYGAWGGE
jgi:hypothetical protein